MPISDISPQPRHKTSSNRIRRDRYHHGDLTNALTQAAVHLASTGGPEAVVLREAARRVGVSATAAYRHFASHQDLMRAVKDRSLAALAATMQRELAAIAPTCNPIEDGLRRLRAAGNGYLHFALRQPGLFRTAFFRGGVSATASPDLGAYRAFQLVSEILDDLVACGGISPDRRPYAPVATWSAVHGLAMLLLDGPLAGLPETARGEAIEAALDLIVAGLGLCPPD
jgi:AcrR family transcriptional regulator